jgi:cell division protein FtsB
MQTRQDHESGTLRDAGPSASGFGSGAGATMTLRQKVLDLQREAKKLQRQVEKLQERNKEQKQWINKLTNKNHPARRAGK